MQVLQNEIYSAALCQESHHRRSFEAEGLSLLILLKIICIKDDIEGPFERSSWRRRLVEVRMQEMRKEIL